MAEDDDVDDPATWELAVMITIYYPDDDNNNDYDEFFLFVRKRVSI